MVTVRNKFDSLQETFERHTPNNEYEKYVTAHIEAAAECIPTKTRAKWESIATHTKRNNLNIFKAKSIKLEIQ